MFFKVLDYTCIKFVCQWNPGLSDRRAAPCVSWRQDRMRHTETFSHLGVGLYFTRTLALNNSLAIYWNLGHFSTLDVHLRSGNQGTSCCSARLLKGCCAPVFAESEALPPSQAVGVFKSFKTCSVLSGVNSMHLPFFFQMKNKTQEAVRRAPQWKCCQWKRCLEWM